MSVQLIEVTAEILDQVLKLSLSEHQKGFVATNAVSIAQSKFYPTIRTDAVYADKAMVGFVMYGFDPEERRYTLIRLMIDERHQGRGYGRSATQEVLKRLKVEADCDAVYLSYVPDNKAAAKLYQSVGFRKTGETDEESGEILMKYLFRED